MRQLKIKGIDPAARVLPKRSLAQHSGSLGKEFINTKNHTRETISAHSTIKANWNCVVCGNQIKGVSVASRVRAIDEARGARGCYICNGTERKQRKPPSPLPEWLLEECIEEKERGLTPVALLMSNTPEHRLWRCRKCKHVFSASVPARCAQEDSQECPNCFPFPEHELTDLTAGRYSRFAPMLIQGSRNTGYGVLKILRRFPIKQRVFWQCDQGKGHERYATLKQVANKGECLTCYCSEQLNLAGHVGEPVAETSLQIS